MHFDNRRAEKRDKKKSILKPDTHFPPAAVRVLLIKNDGELIKLLYYGLSPLGNLTHMLPFFQSFVGNESFMILTLT